MTENPPSDLRACQTCALRPLAVFHDKTPQELERIARLRRGQRQLAAGAQLFATGDEAELFTLYSGWAFRYRLLPDGRRQILNFFLPGDLIGFQASMLEGADHAVEALTDLTLCVFPRRRIWKVFQQMPELAFQLTWLGAREEGMIDDNLSAVGQLSAAERMSAFLVGLFKRAKALNLVENESFLFPLRREHLADALGLSLVHTIKTWSALRRAGLFAQNGSRLSILNPRLTHQLAAYFEATNRPRPLL